MPGPPTARTGLRGSGAGSLSGGLAGPGAVPHGHRAGPRPSTGTPTYCKVEAGVAMTE